MISIEDTTVLTCICEFGSSFHVTAITADYYVKQRTKLYHHPVNSRKKDSKLPLTSFSGYCRRYYEDIMSFTAPLVSVAL
jgi:hypothetical protein